MTFCTNCGQDLAGRPVCPTCGTPAPAATAPGHPPPVPATDSGGSGAKWALVAVLGVALLLIVVGGSVFAISRMVNSSEVVETVPVVPNLPVPTPTPKATTTVTAAPPPLPTQPAAVAYVPPGGTDCGNGVGVNSVTTCPFGLNVRDAYLGSGGAGVLYDVYSPVTSSYYTMTCTGYDPVRCAGGNNAEVFIR